MVHGSEIIQHGEGIEAVFSRAHVRSPGLYVRQTTLAGGSPTSSPFRLLCGPSGAGGRIVTEGDGTDGRRVEQSDDELGDAIAACFFRPRENGGPAVRHSHGNAPRYMARATPEARKTMASRFMAMPP